MIFNEYKEQNKIELKKYYWDYLNDILHQNEVEETLGYNEFVEKLFELDHHDFKLGIPPVFDFYDEEVDHNLIKPEATNNQEALSK
uniref:Uncharacterized protein n=1 Tax=viral metagenome TaxID=1070528 RepID=A0A6H2A5S6_9ZZZZ